jgi:hypothetical protein
MMLKRSREEDRERKKAKKKPTSSRQTNRSGFIHTYENNCNDN